MKRTYILSLFMMMISFNLFSAPMPQSKIIRINTAIKKAMGSYYNKLALEVTKAEIDELTGLLTELGVGTKLFSIHQLSLGLRFKMNMTYVYIEYEEVESFLGLDTFARNYLPISEEMIYMNFSEPEEPIKFRYEFDFESNYILVKAYQITLTRFINKLITNEEVSHFDFIELINGLKQKYIDIK